MKVFVTGATGYVGSRLVPALLRAGHDVVVGSRTPDAVAAFAWADQVQVRRFDVTDTVSVHLSTRDVDVLVYLVHSMEVSGFAARDREAAHSLAAACAYNGVGRLVYLSGLVPPDDDLSEHLRSRLEVEEILTASSTPTTTLRAAMIIGAGSTSFELMRRMSERVPLTPVPSWMRRRIQPVAVEDVVAALVASVDGGQSDRHYDVGGDEVLTYQELLSTFARVAGLVRPQVVVWGAPTRVVGEVVALVSGLPRTTVTALVESLSHDMVCTEDAVRRDLLPGRQVLGVEEAIARSLAGETGATGTEGDVQGQAATDPAWVGGWMQVDGDGQPHGPALPLVAELALSQVRRAARHLGVALPTSTPVTRHIAPA